MSYRQSITVTKSNTVDIAPGFVSDALWIGTPGDGTLAVIMEDGQTASFAGVPVGKIELAVRRVLSTGTGATNIIPNSVVVDFNFRFASVSTAEDLQKRVHEVLDRHGLDYELAWTVGGQPFLTTPGELVHAVQAAIREETGVETELSTTGGTSDGRFISRICPQVIELGPINASIHKIDEHVQVADLDPLKEIYRGVLERLDAL